MSTNDDPVVENTSPDVRDQSDQEDSVRMGTDLPGAQAGTSGSVENEAAMN